MAGAGESTYVWDDTFRISRQIDQYAAVVYDIAAEGYVTLPSASGASAIVGVLQDAKTAWVSGDSCLVRRLGKTKVIAKHALSYGDLVHIGNTHGRVGRPVTWANGDGMLGRMDEAASASGDIVSMTLGISEVR